MNVYYIGGFPVSDQLYHHGIDGMHWGVRRFQDKEGHLTPEGKIRYSTKITSKTTAKDANDIYSTLSADDKLKVIGGVKDAPKEFTNNKEYNAKEHVKSFMLKHGDIPVSIFDIWSEGNGDVAISVMTRSGDEFRNKGYAKKVVKKGMEWIDNNPDILTAYWDVRKDNAASIALAKKSGFKQMVGEGKDPAWTAYHKIYERQ